MAGYFFDTSGIVKRYVTETGRTWVMSLTNPVAGHQVHLVRITGVEVISAIVRRQRGGSIIPADAATMLAANTN